MNVQPTVSKLMQQIFINLTLLTLLMGSQVPPPAAASQSKAPPARAESQRKARPETPREEKNNGPISKSLLAQPFTRLWQYLTDGAVAIPPALDSTRVYLALAGGRIVCLDRETGSLLWSSEPGGVISGDFAVGEDVLYVPSHRVTEDRSPAGASLRALDKETGLTLWVHDYERPFTSPLVLSRDRVYAGSADGACYALSSKNGDVVWKLQTQDVVRGSALATDRVIYFGSDDGVLRGVDVESGREVWKFQAAGRVTGTPCTDNRAIYFGSADGFLYSVNLSTSRLLWRARTGAAIEASPVMVGDKIVVGSFDNFIYCFSRSSGNRTWKRRMDNRITAPVIVESDSILVAPLRSSHVVVLLSSDGRTVNSYKLDSEYEIVTRPVFAAGTLLLSTDKGLVAVSSTRQVNERANVVDK
jgi:outer membrane protein assembly factor BamB